jgi:hypothetical protein
MTEALEVAKMFLLPVDTLTAMFPCQGKGKRPLRKLASPPNDSFPAMEIVRDGLHEQLTKACIYSGLATPAPPSPIQDHYHQSMHM